MAAQFELATCGVLAVLLGVGGVLLLQRSTSGQTMVIIGSGLAVFVWAAIAATEPENDTALVAIVFALISLGILVMASLPSTRRWVEAGPPDSQVGTESAV